MNTNSKLTKADYLKFLQYLNKKSISTDENLLIEQYFGYDHNYIANGIKRAYRDFSRTLWGFCRLPSKDIVREEARNCLKQSFVEVHQNKEIITDQFTFDTWHKQICFSLIEIYQRANFHFYIGQSQKWINMTFKYIYTMGESRVPGFDDFYPFCHVPLDNILISELKKSGFPALSSAWSRIDNYNEYLARQKWVREKFNKPPLDVEFKLWLEGA